MVGMSANALLVPRMGYIGAAWAALAANTSYALLRPGECAYPFAGRVA